MWWTFVAAVLALFLPGPQLAAADNAESFLAALRTKVSAAEREKHTAIAGQDGWLFFVPELRSLSAGLFWGESAAKVSRSS
ncbi:MAG TPA: hypothetical protein VFW87_11510, partial [Pirellulales bacterium]|nr:hypothetical protein [Pirellulales bacterium]